jgi:hypothetical protein
MPKLPLQIPELPFQMPELGFQMPEVPFQTSELTELRHMNEARNYVTQNLIQYHSLICIDHVCVIFVKFRLFQISKCLSG